MCSVSNMPKLNNNIKPTPQVYLVARSEDQARLGLTKQQRLTKVKVIVESKQPTTQSRHIRLGVEAQSRLFQLK